MDETELERYNKYLEQFEPETPNDEQMLHELVAIELQLEKARERLDDLLEDDTVRHVPIKALADVKAKLLLDYQRIQTELGISYSSRAKQKDVTEELPRVIKAAKQFLDDNSIQIICPHCLDEPAKVNIHQGYIVFHFRDDVKWTWEQECPRCGKMFIMRSEP